MEQRRMPLVRGAVTFRGLRVDAERYAASLDDVALPLTRTEFRLLFLFMAHPGYVYTRQQLTTMLHPGESAVSERAVDCHVANLRRKLKHIRPTAQIILTVYGIGYKLDM